MTPTRRDLLIAAGTAVLAAHATAAGAGAAHPARLPHARPEEIGLDPKQLQVAYDLLTDWTNGGKDAPIPGGAILVGRHGKVVPPRFFGRSGPEPDAPPVGPESVFLMASITKPVVYTAALRLVERGKLNLSDPVTRYVPEFKANGKEAVRVRHLFTHTSGLPDMPPGNLELRRKHAPLQAFADAAVRDTTLAFPPGTRVSYQSSGTLVVAEIVRRLSGRPVSDVLRMELFEPLGLASTSLGLGGLERRRAVRVQPMEEHAGGTDFDWNSPYWQDLGAPWGGLFSTAEDFAVICQTLLAGGTRGGVRVLSPATVRSATTNRLYDDPAMPEVEARTKPWGLGWRLNHRGTADTWGDLLGPEVFGHTGATGTMVWMDPRTQGFCILLTNALRARAPWRLVHLSNAVAAAFV
jgi:CubicO group peptidase (beta-lactamase class C family)